MSYITGRWKSGGLFTSDVNEFWEISRTSQDPIIPSLPLENGPVTFAPVTVADVEDETDEEESEQAVFGSVFTASASADAIIAGFWESPDADDEDDPDDASAVALFDPPAVAPAFISSAFADDDDEEETVDNESSLPAYPLNDPIACAFEIEADDSEEDTAADFIAQQIAVFQIAADFIQAVLDVDVDLEDDDEDGSYISLTTTAGLPPALDYIAGPLDPADDEFQDDDEVAVYANAVEPPAASVTLGPRPGGPHISRATRRAQPNTTRPTGLGGRRR